MDRPTKEKVLSKLEEVMDPELFISIVDLGLIYEVNIEPMRLHIVMTLTTMGCPLFSVIEKQMREKIVELGVPDSQIEIEVVFDPPWSMDRMSESGKAMLGI